MMSSFKFDLETLQPDFSAEILKKTTSRCPVCKQQKPAEVIKTFRNGKEQILMRRYCQLHGPSEFIISSDARFYWMAKGNPANSCGCGPSCSPAGQGGKDGTLGKNALDEAKHGTIEKLSTCLALIEIVDSCNLKCPTCYADSPFGKDETLKYHSFENITARVQGVIDRKGHIEILQFSGGEPTIHPEFFRLAEWVCENPEIDVLLINTNGVLLAQDRQFVATLGELEARYGKTQLYLQFDGVQEAGQIELRGADLRAIRDKAIRNCESINLPITLAMTVTQHNLSRLWETVMYAKPFEHVRGVSFQPMFLSGRNSAQELAEPITAADVILGLYEQSDEVLLLDDFTSLPCGDPNCLVIGWLMRTSAGYFSPSQFGVDIAALQASLPDRVNYSIEDLQKCGCDNTVLGDLMKKFEVRSSNAFRLSIKPFMDERTWDEDRIDRCCTHVIKPDGMLDSFCRYYFGTRAESNLLELKLV